MIPIVVCIVLVVVVFGASGFEWVRRSQGEAAKVELDRGAQPKKAKKRSPHPDTPECRAAVHEAGHALVAWACFIVDRITFVQLEGKGGGRARYRYWDPTLQNDYDWCATVIGLGGLGAEIMLYKEASTGGSAEDLLAARESIVRLVDGGALSPPWEVVDTSPMPFAHLFEPPLSDAERQGLEIAYGKTCELLRDGAAQHARLVGALLHQRQLSYAQVLGILGERHWMAAKVLSNVLKRPGAMQAGFVKIDDRSSSPVLKAS